MITSKDHLDWATIEFKIYYKYLIILLFYNFEPDRVLTLKPLRCAKLFIRFSLAVSYHIALKMVYRKTLYFCKALILCEWTAIDWVPLKITLIHTYMGRQTI